MKILSTLKKITFIAAIFLSFNYSYIKAEPLSTGACTAATHGGGSLMEIFNTSTATLYNVFPITIAGVPINFFPKLEDTDSSSNSPICICMRGAVPIPGVTLSLWEPLSIVETTGIPGCSPTTGISLPLTLSPMQFQAHSKGNIASNENETYQSHYIKYPTFALLGLFIDFVCLESSGGLDYLYITEFDPLWQNDIWSAILAPESYLVANPIAQMSCMADSVSATLSWPLDPLFWCFGAWGSAYPLTENMKGAPAPETSAAIVARTLLKMHRELLLWGSVGNQAMCGFAPQPVMRKSQYSVFPLYPIPSHPFRIPIGRAGFLWNLGMEIPVANMNVWAWAVYRKRDCCAL